MKNVLTMPIFGVVLVLLIVPASGGRAAVPSDLSTLENVKYGWTALRGGNYSVVANDEIFLLGRESTVKILRETTYEFNVCDVLESNGIWRLAIKAEVSHCASLGGEPSVKSNKLIDDFTISVNAVGCVKGVSRGSSKDGESAVSHDMEEIAKTASPVFLELCIVDLSPTELKEHRKGSGSNIVWSVENINPEMFELVGRESKTINSANVPTNVQSTVSTSQLEKRCVFNRKKGLITGGSLKRTYSGDRMRSTTTVKFSLERTGGENGGGGVIH